MEQLGLDVTDLLMPWISVLISLLVAIWMKDYATSLAKGLKFKRVMKYYLMVNYQ